MNVKMYVRILLLGIVIILSSCDLFGTRLSPPEWIIGSWENTLPEAQTFIEFREDTVIFGQGQNSMDFAASQRAWDRVEGDSVYVLTAEHLNIEGEAEYRFELQADDSLLYTANRQGFSEPIVTELVRVTDS
ncbi:hypothetical protein [Spirochaeta dissipatitropha]